MKLHTSRWKLPCVVLFFAAGNIWCLWSGCQGADRFFSCLLLWRWKKNILFPTWHQQLFKPASQPNEQLGHRQVLKFWSVNLYYPHNGICWSCFTAGRWFRSWINNFARTKTKKQLIVVGVEEVFPDLATLLATAWRLVWENSAAHTQTAEIYTI